MNTFLEFKIDKKQDNRRVEINFKLVRLSYTTNSNGILREIKCFKSHSGYCFDPVIDTDFSVSFNDIGKVIKLTEYPTGRSIFSIYSYLHDESRSREKLMIELLKTNNMKYYLGIDPGKQGAFVIIDENSNVIEKIGVPLIGKEYDRQEIVSILTKYPYHKIGLENPDIIFGIGKSAVASLSHCVGLIEGMMLGLKTPFILIKPKEWQKECWKHVKTQKKVDGKTNDTKATSIMAAVNLWPAENFKITNVGNVSKNHNEGMIDAVLVAEYVRRMFK